MMIQAIIVDDEQSAIKSLKWEIEQFCEGIEIIGAYDDPSEAIIAINTSHPDCVFLDIEMPEMDGFQLLGQLGFRDFDLIITTAFDSYALKAFKECAIDYLLKPVDSDDLVQAVKKVKNNKSKNELGAKLNELISSTQTAFSKIALPLSGKTIFVEAAEILYCKSDGNYTEIFFKEARREVLSKKLKDVEALINDPLFVRVHNSFLVNISYIREYSKRDALVVLENGSTVPVSRAKKDDLLKVILR